MEWGEQPHETALRELHEETGLHAQIGPLLGVQSEWFDGSMSTHGQRGMALRLIFEIHACEGKLRTDFSRDDTTIAAKWFPIADVHRLDRVEVVGFGLSLAGIDLSAS